jgi:peptidylprolyl isomerase
MACENNSRFLLRIFSVIIPLLAIVVCIGLIAGGDDSLSASRAAESNGPANSASRSQGSAAAAASEVGKTKPQVQIPKAPPPTELEVTDLVTGTGPEAKEGDVVRVEYVVLLQKNGKEVYSSWGGGGKPLSFELGGGGGGVTPGWEQGIKGMRKGGRRELVAPAGLSYGKAGDPPTVGPNEALVSVIDLLEVKEPAPARGPAPSP